MAGKKLAIDFGSSYTKIYMYGVGVVLVEPTVVAVSTDGRNDIRAIGSEAKKLIGKTAENTRTIFPVYEGEIVNVRLAEAVLKYFIKKIEYKNKIFGNSVVFSVPCGADYNSIKKLTQVATAVGFNDISFVEAPLLTVLGQCMPVSDFTPYFIIDCGGGVTNIATVSLDGVISGLSVNYGGSKIDSDLIDYIAERYGIQIGIPTAESLKINIGTLDSNDILAMNVSGRDVTDGRPLSITIKACDICKPIREYFDKILEIASDMIYKLPPEVSAEINRSGIYLAGALSSMHGLEDYIANKLKVKVTIAKEPQIVTVLGGGAFLGRPELGKKLRLKDSK